ncbi:MAG: phage portal protein [Cucumibacter sp.]
MSTWLDRFTGAPAREEKASALKSLMAIYGGEASWTGRSFPALAIEGMARNPVVYRCVRLISESVARIPLAVEDATGRLTEHPVLALLGNPNPRHSGAELVEQICLYLETAGDAFLEAVFVEEDLRAIYCLRPDRVRMVPGPDGWPRAYEYAAAGKTRLIPLGNAGVAKVLHLGLLHPLDDHDGLSPLNAAQTSLDIHNAASRWNKALLDNAARPSGALVYTAGNGNLTEEQFERLKSELERGYQGAINAGRPLVLDGGLDWKPLSLTPKDMDFIETKNSAARDIALAFGVPPMLLGIPGDNTYANFVEANRTLWRQTVIPLAMRVTATLTQWLQAAYEGPWRLVPQLDQVEALATERAALWEQIGKADFLTADEKRQRLGLPPLTGR